MISALFHDFLYQPLYNGLVYLVDIMPGQDIGLAVVALTVIVKFIMLPLSHRTIHTQVKMKEIEPHLTAIREKFKDDKKEQALKTMELYREHGINPFSGFFTLLIQFPIIFALYWVFWKGLKNGIQAEELYAFIEMPEMLNLHFLGLFDLSGKNMILALIAAATQYLQIHFSMPPQKITKELPKNPSFRDEFAKSFNTQLKFGLPIIVFFVSYSISGVIALYWSVSNIFTILHQFYVLRKAKHMADSKNPS